MFDFGREVIPQESADKRAQRAAIDRSCYMQGKKDSNAELDRRGNVLYKDSRDRDCYNMGYSSEIR